MNVTRQVVTIREAVRRSQDDGIPVSEYALRQWIRLGLIPTRTIGQKALLYYPNLVRHIQCEDNCDNKPATVAAIPGIRRVEN